MPVAPNYRWLCHLCEFANPAGSAVCSQCGFKAQATGRQIERALGRGQQPDVRLTARGILIGAAALVAAVTLKLGWLWLGNWLYERAPWLLVLLGVVGFVVWLANRAPRLAAATEEQGAAKPAASGRCSSALSKQLPDPEP